MKAEGSIVKHTAQALFLLAMLEPTSGDKPRTNFAIRITRLPPFFLLDALQARSVAKGRAAACIRKISSN
jgi:hypothetical protein